MVFPDSNRWYPWGMVSQLSLRVLGGRSRVAKHAGDRPATARRRSAACPGMIARGTAATKRDTMAIWDAQHETIDRERLAELQLRRLGDMLARVYERVPFYREQLDVAGFQPGDLTSLGRRRPACRSPRRPTSATTTPTACSPCP